MLGEGVGAGLGELEAGEVVAICDHISLFLRGKLKNEVGRETLCVALDLFIEAFGRHAVEGSEVGVQNNLLSSNGEDERIESSTVSLERIHDSEKEERVPMKLVLGKSLSVDSRLVSV